MAVRAAYEHFLDWLPGELETLVAERPYPATLEQARLNPVDSGSMVASLGADWNTAQLLARDGRHHDRLDQETAQLQFAKFAAGVFDKFGLLDWLGSGRPEDPEAMNRYARAAASCAVSAIRHPSGLGGGDTAALQLVDKVDHELPFAFLFEGNLAALQRGINHAVESQPNPDTINRLKKSALNLGLRATAGYINYAHRNLSLDELALKPMRRSD